MVNRLHDLTSGLQAQLEASLGAARLVNEHPGAMGEASEDNWLAMLKEHLPHRYQADRAFVIDSNGTESQQIDVVIYDRQYTPCLYNAQEHRFIPAESVYAVFEVKQDLSREHVVYAGEKAASVRRLHRTSADITYAVGERRRRPLLPILAGLLTYTSGWSPPFGEAFQTAISERSVDERLDIGCAVSAGGYEVEYAPGGLLSYRISPREKALIFFFLRLLERLQALGTVPGIDYTIYNQALLG